MVDYRILSSSEPKVIALAETTFTGTQCLTGNGRKSFYNTSLAYR